MDERASSLWFIVFWTAICLLMVTLTVVIVKRRLRKRQNSEVQTGSPFSLAELDEMYRKGLISKEEFAALRKKMIMEITGEGGGKTKSSQPR